MSGSEIVLSLMFFVLAAAVIMYFVWRGSDIVSSKIEYFLEDGADFDDHGIYRKGFLIQGYSIYNFRFGTVIKDKRSWDKRFFVKEDDARMYLHLVNG